MKPVGKTIVATCCLAAIAWAGVRFYEYYEAVSSVQLTTGAVARPMTPADPSVFSPFQVVPPFPAITNAPVATASQIKGEVTENELVLGVEVNGEARAYPINMLTGPDREIINDHLGGVAIAATW